MVHGTWSLATQWHSSSDELLVPPDNSYPVALTEDHRALDYSWGFDPSRSRLG